MVKKLATLFLGALLLVQATHSAPAESAEKLLDDLTNIFKAIEDRFEILEVTLDELFNLEDYVKDKGSALLTKVLNDPKVLEVKSEDIKKILNDIREYKDEIGKEQTNKKDEKNSKANILEYINFENFVKKFKKNDAKNLTPEEEIIGNSLKENGLDDFEKEISDQFNDFAEKFVKQLDEYIKKLSDDDKKEEKKLVDWHKEFLDEKDILKKFKIFSEFFVSVSKDSKENSKE